MLEARIEQDRIVVSGASLKFKHALRQAVPSEEFVYTGKAQLAFSLRHGFLAHEVLLRFDCQLSEDLKEKLSSAKERYDKHLSARDVVIRFQEDCAALTGWDRWDSVLKWYQGLEVNCMTVDGLLGMCLFDEQGTGKTLSAIAAFDILKEKGSVEILFVVGPKTVLGIWEEHLNGFLPGKYRLSTLEGSIESKFRRLQERADVYLMNFESVIPSLTSLVSLATDFRAMLVVDESDLAKNPEAQRSAAVRRLRTFCEKAYVLCGAPAPNRPEDIVHQFDISDDGFTFSGFRPTKDAGLNFSEIENRIYERGIFVRNLKSEVLPDLPPKRFEVTEVEMVGRQRLLYEEAKSELVLYLRNLDNSTFRRNLATYFQKRAVLLQICVSPKTIDKTYDETPAKYVQLDDIVKSVVQEGNRKIVIWSFYTRSLDELESRYDEYGVVRIDGRVGSSTERAQLVRGFQTDPSLRVFIGNPAAAGAGITLHAASDCAYVSFSNQASHYMQSLDRVHRIGQMAPEVKYNFLICRNTIEEAELRRLSHKERTQKRLLKDPRTEEPTLAAALAELGVS